MCPGGVVQVHHGNLKIWYRKEQAGFCDALELMSSATESSRIIGNHLLL